MTHYKTLGVKPESSLEEINLAYENAINLSTENAKRQALIEAYNILKDNQKRQAYDQQLQMVEVGEQGSAAPREITVPINQILDVFEELRVKKENSTQANTSLLDSRFEFEVIPGYPKMYRFTFPDTATAEKFIEELKAKGYVVVNTQENQTPCQEAKQKLHELRSTDTEHNNVMQPIF